MPRDRQAQIDRIASNIRQSGFHMYLVMARAVPRYLYTIGLLESLGHELVLAGGVYYMRDEAARIITGIRDKLATGAARGDSVTVDGLGAFSLQRAHRSWSELLLKGASDYYSVPNVDAYQIVPDGEHQTIDRTQRVRRCGSGCRCLGRSTFRHRRR